MSVEVKHLDEVIASFDKAGAELPKGARNLVQDAAKNIRDGWKREWRGKFRHAPRIERSITYSTSVEGPIITAEVGPEDEPVNQGYLGGILEYGALHSGPHPGGVPAAAAEEPRYAAALDEYLTRIGL